jgi:hypothetical protein
MSRSSIFLILATILLIVCLCEAAFTDRHYMPNHRQKRGFRGDAATRVAHGFGKRSYMGASRSRLAQLAMETPESFSDTLDSLVDGSILSVDEFAQLLTLHPNILKALLRKFVDLDGDDIISTEELFRPTSKE